MARGSSYQQLLCACIKVYGRSCIAGSARKPLDGAGATAWSWIQLSFLILYYSKSKPEARRRR